MLTSGSGGTFGDSHNDSYVYVGGLPSSYWRNMSALTAPSAMFLPRYNGYIRNVLYGNCSCMRLRAGLPLDGDGYTTLSATDDACESPGVRHNCTRRCLCVGTDQGPACDCTETGCNGGRLLYFSSSHHHLVVRWAHAHGHRQAYALSAYASSPLSFIRQKLFTKI